MTKMTYVDALNTVLTSATLSDEVSEKLTALRDQLVKRNSADHKPTKTQQANEGVKDAIVAWLSECGKAVSATEVMTQFDLPSNQKASALLKQLVDDKRIERCVDGRKTTFKALG